MKVIVRYQDVLDIINDGMPTLRITVIDAQITIHKCKEER